MVLSSVPNLTHAVVKEPKGVVINVKKEMESNNPKSIRKVCKSIME